MKKNQKAFSLAVAMGLVLITSLLAYTILEYMIPFSRNIKWIENSTMAYYNSNKWIEIWLSLINWRQDDELDVWYSRSYESDRVYDYEFNSSVIWSTLPENGMWDSYYDNDYNKIMTWNPIQLSIWYWMLSWWNIDVIFRVPDLNEDSLFNQELVDISWDDMWIINWQLTSASSTLNSHSGSLIKVSEVNDMTTWSDNIPPDDLDMWSRDWRLLDWSSSNFSSFYNSNCNWSNECILKFSVINELITSDWGVPYLEWQIDTWSDNIPYRYSRIYSEGESYWFVKQIDVRVPQETVSEAFDFTVIQ